MRANDNKDGEEVVIRWHLHACFSITYAGKVLVIDPHDGASIGVGIVAPRLKADYILVSHEHYDHNAVEVVANNNSIIIREKLGEFSLGPYTIRGVRAPHDEFEGKIRGYVTIYVIRAGDLVLAHLSDLGRPLDDKESEEIGEVDIALVPAGNVYTLHPRQALEVAESLKAKLVIPMHYWLPGIHLPLDPLDAFLRFAKKWKIDRRETNTIKVSPQTLPEKPTIIVLSPPSRDNGK